MLFDIEASSCSTPPCAGCQEILPEEEEGDTEFRKEFNSLEELLDFQKTIDAPIILSSHEDKFYIEIYDSYRE